MCEDVTFYMVMNHHPFLVNEKGHLEIDQIDAVQLAKKYWAPLYVYDVSLIRKNCRAFVDTFKKLGVTAQVAYGSKAFSSIAIFQVIAEEGLSVDVVSAGELHTALKANFPAERIHFHGNNKSETELAMAIDNNIGCIVVDNFHEINLLEKLLREKNKQMDVLIRVTPGIESETHRYIMTGNEDSKFGFNLQNGQVDDAFIKLYNHPNIKLKGLHSHIGSQIFSSDSFLIAVNLLFEKIAQWKDSRSEEH